MLVLTLDAKLFPLRNCKDEYEIFTVFKYYIINRRSLYKIN